MNSTIDHLAIEVGEVLLTRNCKLVTVESCTGGWVSQAVTSVSGSSNWFDRGFVTYSNEAKQELVGVQADSLEVYGAVSETVAIEMAIGGLNNSCADIAVSVTGIAGPDGGTPNKPVGTVWIGWANRSGKATAKCYRFSGDRNAVRRETVQKALSGIHKFIPSKSKMNG